MLELVFNQYIKRNESRINVSRQPCKTSFRGLLKKQFIVVVKLTLQLLGELYCSGMKPPSCSTLDITGSCSDVKWARSTVCERLCSNSQSLEWQMDLPTRSDPWPSDSATLFQASLHVIQTYKVPFCVSATCKAFLPLSLVKCLCHKTAALWLSLGTKTTYFKILGKFGLVCFTWDANSVLLGESSLCDPPLHPTSTPL